MRSINEEYAAKHRKSQDQFTKARTLFPSGVTHDTRYVTPFPIYISHGKGARKWDIEGNEYICYVMGHGSLLLGHSHPDIVSAVSQQMELGTHLGSNTILEMEWAAAVKTLVPSIEKLRFVSSGTEATLMALRLARAFTKKNKIVKFRDHFHGWHDYLIGEAGKYSSVGIPPAITQSVVVLEDNNISAVQEQLEKDKDIAAVILEPTGGMMGCLPLAPVFLQQLRDLCTRHGVVLIFDEVVTGFRVSAGGAQERFQVRPDLTALGKILGGGLPGAAIGGRAEILDLISFHDDPKWDASARVSHPGTFNANPLSAAAGSKCLQIIRASPVCVHAENAATLLRSGLNSALKTERIHGVAYGLASLAWVLFGNVYEGEDMIPSIPRDTIKRSLSSSKMQLLKKGMINEGVHMMGAAQFIVSAVHSDKDIDDTVHAFEQVLHQMRIEGAFNES